MWGCVCVLRCCFVIVVCVVCVFDVVFVGGLFASWSIWLSYTVCFAVPPRCSAIRKAKCRCDSRLVDPEADF